MVGDVAELLYNKVLITKGDLAGFQNVTATPQAGNGISLNWEDNSAQGNADATDLANAICYCEELGSFEIFESVAERSVLTANVTLPAYYAGKEIQLWVFFHNARNARLQQCLSRKPDFDLNVISTRKGGDFLL